MSVSNFEPSAGVLGPSEASLATRVEDEMLIFDVSGDRFFGLRGAAARMWELIDEQAHTADDLVARLCDEFDADQATVRRDVATILGHLWSHGLVRML